MILTHTTRHLIKTVINTIFVFLIVCLSCIPISAASYLTTIVVIPEKSIQYDDCDSCYITLLNNETGKTIYFKTYAYNNFSSKELVEEGSYSVLDTGITGRNNIIFECSSDIINVYQPSNIVIKLKDTQIVNTTTTQTTQKQPETKTETSTITTTAPTLLSIPSSTTKQNTTIESTSENTTSVPSKIEMSSIQTTTIPSTASNVLTERSTTVGIKIFLSVLIVIVLIILTFFITLRKKNKETSN